jgi:hypothetical protein
MQGWMKGDFLPSRVNILAASIVSPLVLYGLKAENALK